MKKILISLLMVSFLFIGACGQEQSESKGPFFGGINGVSVSFIDGYPPSQINQDQSVPVKVLLKNEGETDLKPGDARVKLFGPVLEQYSLSGAFVSTIGNLRGKSELLLEGGSQEVELGNLKYIREVVNSLTTKLRAKVCYPYETEGRISVCMKSAAKTEGGELVICDVEGEKVVAGSVSSAPVQITSVTEELLGSNRVKFNILIKNSGVGDVHYKDYTCEEIDEDRIKGKDDVYIDIADPDIQCSFRDGTESNKGKVTLNNKPLICWKTVEESYEDVLPITLSYKYVDRTEKDIEIVEV